ncbi:hypothetical protein AAF712_003372 [Marasmius tenuissimus]|uniref:Enoyl reductase (ER) domain-containing protein n=1 Tax=Marasmius tenuissimus TaxID=585030 RepID=A0ABR3A8L9_9AGAR
MSEQKALVLPTSSSPYTIISKPIPVPGFNEVLVKLQAVGLKPSEWKITEYPQILNLMGSPVYTGTDGAGVVEAVGEEVTQLKRGDRVLFQGWFSANYSAHQQYALAPSNMVVKLPAAISTLEAVSLVGLATAAFGFCLPNPAVSSLSEIARNIDVPFFTQGRAGAGIVPFWEEGAKGLKSGQPLVVLGGSSTVGQLAIQIAAYYGFAPIITTSSAKHAEFLQSLGATHVIDRNTPVEKVKAVLGGTAIEYIFAAVDAVSQAYVDLLAPGGTLITTLHVPAEIVFRDRRKSALTNGAGHLYKELGYGLMGVLGGLLESGVIKPIRVEKLPGGLAGIPDGLARLEKNQVSGLKLVVDPTETP